MKLLTSQYSAGDVIFLEYLSTEQDTNGIIVKVKHEGEEKDWCLKFGDKRLDLLPKVRGQRFRLVMKDTGRKFAYALVEGPDTTTPLPQIEKQQAEQKVAIEKRTDETTERIIRGQCFNNACTLLAGKNAESDFLKVTAQELYDEFHDWLLQ